MTSEETKEGAKQREMGTRPVGRLLISFAMPSIIAMTATSLYNLMDSIFIGNGVGTYGLTGLTVTFPLMNLSAAFGAMVGVGAGSVVAVKLGQKDVRSAEYTLGNVVLLNVVISILFSVVALLNLDRILIFFGASENSLPYAREYMEVLLYGNVLTHLYLGLNDVVRSSGYPQKAMLATLTSVIVNAGLDYLFIMKLGMGIRGAAVATLAAQLVAFCVVVYHLTRRTSYVRFRRGIFRWRPQIAKGILSIGCAPFFNNSCACLVVLLINNGLKDYGGDYYISAYGIVNRLAFIFVMITNGINQGMQPISGYNFGAGQVGRSIRVFKFAAIGGVAVMTGCFMMAELFPRQVIAWFTDEASLVDIAEHAMMVTLMFAPLGGFQIVSTGFMMSLGKAKQAIFLSTTRQMLFLVPGLIALPRYLGTDGVWYSLPLADLAAGAAAIVVVMMQLGKLRKMEQKR